MKNRNQKIQSLKEGVKFNIPLIGSRGRIYRVTEKAIQINCANNGMLWIPKMQINDIDETTGEILLTNGRVRKINRKRRGSSVAY